MPSTFRQKLRARLDRHELYSRPQFWNQKAVDHRGSSVSMWPNRTLNFYYEREQFAFIDGALGEISGKKILDIGCGTGRLSRHLAASGARVTAFDFASEAVQIAKTTSPDDPIDYSVRSVFDIDEIAAYDGAVALASLTFACRDRGDVVRVLRAIHRALRPRTKLVVVDSLHQSFLTRVLSMTARDFNGLLADAGFRVLAHEELHFWPARLYLCMFDLPKTITAVGYHCGQAFLRIGGAQLGLGDYKGIAAVRLD